MSLTTNTGTLTITAAASGPSWLPAIGAIVVVPAGGTTALSAANAAGAASYTGGAHLTEPWAGGVLVYVSGLPYLAVEGGGHNDSAFNGIVKFGPLFGAGSDTPTWSTFLGPSPTGAVVANTAAYTDGRQSANHTYNSLAADQGGSVYYSTQTAPFGNGGWVSGPTFRKSPSGQTQVAACNTTAQSQCSHGYAGKIFSIGGNGVNADRLRIYDIAGNSWSSESAADFFFLGDPCMAVDTLRGAILVCDTTAATYWSAVATSPVRVTGKNPVGSGWTKAVVYDPDRDAFVALVAGSASVKELSASSLAAGGNPSWTTRSFTGATPSAAEANGTFGRFRYVPELRGYIYLPAQASSVYFFRSTGTSAYSTNFNIAETTISESGRWTRQTPDGGASVHTGWHDVTIISGTARPRFNAGPTGGGPGSGDYDDSYSYLTGTWFADMESTATLYVGSGNKEVELLFRCSDTSNTVRTYECTFDSGAANFAIVRWNGNPDDFTILAESGGTLSGPTLNNGDRIRARCSGTNPVVIQMWYSRAATPTTWVSIGSFSDSSVSRIASGAPGIGFFARTGNSLDFGITDFQTVQI